MPDNLPNNNPLSYLGVRPEHPPEIIKARRAPTPTDLNHKIGDTWIDEVGKAAYILVDISLGSAVWDQYALSSGGPIDTLTGDSGGVISPTGGNIDVLGGDLLTVDGTVSTLTLNPTTGGYPISPYVTGNVGESGYGSIQDIINVLKPLFGPHVIWVQGGALIVENLDFSGFAFSANVHIRAVPLNAHGPIDGVTIIGNHIPPTTGRVLIENINLEAGSGDIFASAAAGSSEFILRNCGSHTTAGGYIFNLPNWISSGIITIENHEQNALATSNGAIVGGNSTVNIRDCYYLGNLTSETMVLNGITNITNSAIHCPVNLGTSAILNIEGSEFFEPVTLSGNSTGNINNSVFSTGSSASITMSSSSNTSLSHCTIDTSSSPAIDGAGAGIIDLSEVSFLAQSAIAGTVNISRNSHTETGIVSAKGLDIQEGANARMGTVNFTAGLALVATTAVTATSRIFLTINTPGGTVGSPYVFNRTPGVDFTISSTNGADGSAVAWMIVEPA